MNKHFTRITIILIAVAAALTFTSCGESKKKTVKKTTKPKTKKTGVKKPITSFQISKQVMMT